MNILITGIHGFVGTNLVNTLIRSHNIYGLDILSSQQQKGIIRTFSWDDIESEDFPSIDAIIHLAGKAHDTKNRSQANEYFEVNTGLTKKIFDFFLGSSATKFIFFSSVKAAADFVPGEILTEDIVPAPRGPYGESKIAAEKYINSKSEEVSNPKKVYILRPCMIHGPGNKGNLNLLYNVIKKGIPWPLGAFENRRSFTSVDNLSFIIKGILEANIPSGIYHVADDEALSTNELITTMCEAMGKKAHIWKISKSLINGSAKLGTVLHLPLNTERLQKLTENYVVSNAKIKSALGVEKLPMTAKEGLIKTIKSFKA